MSNTTWGAAVTCYNRQDGARDVVDVQFFPDQKLATAWAEALVVRERRIAPWCDYDIDVRPDKAEPAAEFERTAPEAAPLPGFETLRERLTAACRREDDEAIRAAVVAINAAKAAIRPVVTVTPVTTPPAQDRPTRAVGNCRRCGGTGVYRYVPRHSHTGRVCEGTCYNCAGGGTYLGWR